MVIIRVQYEYFKIVSLQTREFNNEKVTQLRIANGYTG